MYRVGRGNGQGSRILRVYDESGRFGERRALHREERRADRAAWNSGPRRGCYYFDR